MFAIFWCLFSLILLKNPKASWRRDVFDLHPSDAGNEHGVAALKDVFYRVGMLLESRFKQHLSPFGGDLLFDARHGEFGVFTTKLVDAPCLFLVQGSIQHRGYQQIRRFVLPPPGRLPQVENFLRLLTLNEGDSKGFSETGFDVGAACSCMEAAWCCCWRFLI